MYSLVVSTVPQTQFNYSSTAPDNPLAQQALAIKHSPIAIAIRKLKHVTLYRLSVLIDAAAAAQPQHLPSSRHRHISHSGLRRGGGAGGRKGTFVHSVGAKRSLLWQIQHRVLYRSIYPKQSTHTFFIHIIINKTKGLKLHQLHISISSKWNLEWKANTLSASQQVQSCKELYLQRFF